MGVIGRSSRDKVSRPTTPGPDNYHPQTANHSIHVSFASKYKKTDPNINNPGPGAYQSTSKQLKKGVKIGRQPRFITDID